MIPLQRVFYAFFVFTLLITAANSASAAPVLLFEEARSTAIARVFHEIQPALSTQATFSHTLDHTQTAAFAAQFATPQHHKTITSSSLAYLQEIADILAERKNTTLRLTFTQENGSTRTLHLSFTFGYDSVDGNLVPLLILTATSTAELTQYEIEFLQSIIKSDGFLATHGKRVLGGLGVGALAILGLVLQNRHNANLLKQALKDSGLDCCDVFYPNSSMASVIEEDFQLNSLTGFYKLFCPSYKLNACENGSNCWELISSNTGSTTEIIVVPLSSVTWLLGGVTELQQIANCITNDVGSLFASKNFLKAIDLLIQQNSNIIDLVFNALSIPPRTSAKKSIIWLFDDLQPTTSASDLFSGLSLKLKDPAIYKLLLQNNRFDDYIVSLSESSTGKMFYHSSIPSLKGSNTKTLLRTSPLEPLFQKISNQQKTHPPKPKQPPKPPRRSPQPRVEPLTRFEVKKLARPNAYFMENPSDPLECPEGTSIVYISMENGMDWMRVLNNIHRYDDNKRIYIFFLASDFEPNYTSNHCSDTIAVYTTLGIYDEKKPDVKSKHLSIIWVDENEEGSIKRIKPLHGEETSIKTMEALNSLIDERLAIRAQLIA